MKRFTALLLLALLLVATSAMAAPRRSIHVAPGDSVAVVVDGQQQQQSALAAPAGLTKVDRALLRENIAESKAAKKSADDAKHAILAVHQEAREAWQSLAFWQGWSPNQRFWAFVFTLAAIVLAVWLGRRAVAVTTTVTTGGDPNRTTCAQWPCWGCPYRQYGPSNFPPKQEEKKPEPKQPVETPPAKPEGSATLTATFTVPEQFLGHPGVKGEAHLTFEGSAVRQPEAPSPNPATAPVTEPPAGSITQ